MDKGKSVVEDNGSSSSDNSIFKVDGTGSSESETDQRKMSGRIHETLKWTEEDDRILISAVMEHKGKHWKLIAKNFKDKNADQCRFRWKDVLDPDIVKGPWNKEEDDQLTRLVSQLGTGKWAELSRKLPGRTGQQCRKRWNNVLDPKLKKVPWTDEEKKTVIAEQKKIGDKWGQIGQSVKARSDEVTRIFKGTVRKLTPCKSGFDTEKARSSSLSHKSPGLSKVLNEDVESTKKHSGVTGLDSSRNPGRIAQAEYNTLSAATELFGIAVSGTGASFLSGQLSQSSLHPKETLQLGPSSSASKINESLDDHLGKEASISRGKSKIASQGEDPSSGSLNHKLTEFCAHCVLRRLASSFKGTPSIIRRRKDAKKCKFCGSEF